MKLYSAWYCPFAQRAWMALLLKGIEFEYIEVDPYRKSDWWLTISRDKALVPVIVTPDSDSPVIDSTRIVEYLEDLEPNTHPLLPGDPNQRAEQRYWMDHINSSIVPYLYRHLQATEEGEYRDDSKASLISGVQKLASAMSPDRPFFLGSQITAVDVLMAPFAYRIDVLLGHYRGLSLPTEGEAWHRYQNWYQAILEHPVFMATSTDHDDYPERLIESYLPFSQGKGQKDVTETD